MKLQTRQPELTRAARVSGLTAEMDKYTARITVYF